MIYYFLLRNYPQLFICSRYVHYEVDGVTSKDNLVNALNSFPPKKEFPDKSALKTCQWIQCDLRYMNFTFLGEYV